jgi:hypothetical protein
MISIIICSTKTDIPSLLRKNIEDTIGVENEVIVIDNSNNKYSIFSAYNHGLSQAKYSNLCFIHEDLLFKNENWGKNLINHLNHKQIGIIGVAGGKMMTRIPAHWWSAGPGSKNIIQHYDHKKTSNLELNKGFSANCEPAILLDGVFLSCRKELFDIIRFDEKLTGFHGYDQDISVQATVAGYHNLVVSDILIEHFSAGNINTQYYTNLLKIYRKWKVYLPIFTTDISEEIKAKTSKKEIILLAKLIRRLAQTGFTTSEIISETRYYVDILNNPSAKKLLRFIHIKIAFEKIFHSK